MELAEKRLEEGLQIGIRLVEWANRNEWYLFGTCLKDRTMDMTYQFNPGNEVGQINILISLYQYQGFVWTILMLDIIIRSIITLGEVHMHAQRGGGH